MLILQLTLVVILLIAIEVFLYKRFLLKGIVYRRSISENAVFEGEEISLIEDIENNNLLPIPWMKAESRISTNLKLSSAENLQSTDGYHRSVFSIMPFYRIKRTHKVFCLLRGEYNLGNVTITSGDILGFVTKIISNDEFVRLLVYPTPLPDERVLKIFHSLQGDVVVRRFINPDPFLVAGVRQYQPGDPISMISWKATARTNTFQVYKYDYSSDSNLLIIFNIDSSNGQDRFPNKEECSKLEYGIHFCAAIVEKLIKNGSPAGFCTNGHFADSSEFVFIPPLCSKTHLYSILEAMARLQLHRSCSIHTMMKKIRNTISKNTDILIISLYTDENIEEQIHEYRRDGHKIEMWNPNNEGVV
jgi:uncharacterized protein (DUF58 family)